MRVGDREGREGDGGKGGGREGRGVGREEGDKDEGNSLEPGN